MQLSVVAEIVVSQFEEVMFDLILSGLVGKRPVLGHVEGRLAAGLPPS